MRFISNGDYVFPLDFPSYLTQHIYTWSFERGAANPDGIMRLPGRLADLAVFAAFGSLEHAYFYVISCVIIAFLSFLWFARSFLDARRWGTALLGALFFALNPIFLGNLSKVGLILAVAMLPLALTALKRGFQTRRFSFFLVYIVALNISLVHPFTFTVNLALSLGYAVYLARTHRPFMRDNVGKFVALGAIALLLNAYLILPLVSMRTLDKSVLSNTVSTTPVDHSGLVDVANTGDIFTGLSLSKAVLKDYEFYGMRSWPFYFLGVFLFYLLLIGVYISVEKRTKPHERRRFLAAMSVFLALVVLATASYLYADVFLKFLVGLPGGWMFRSPLKWQLYMPVALFAALVIALKYVHRGWRLKTLYGAFLLSFVLMNGYLFTQVYARLLKPKTITHFVQLQQTDMQGKHLLVADSGACITLAQNNPSVATELNQVLLSKKAQVKHAQAGNLDAVNLSQYDYVLSCGDTVDEQLLSNQFAFTREAYFLDGAYTLYRNTKPAPYVGTTGELFAVGTAERLGGKYAVATEKLDQPFVFITAQTNLPRTGLQDLFEGFSPGDITEGIVRKSLTPLVEGSQALYVTGESPLFYAQQDNRITFWAQKPKDSPEVKETKGGEPITLTIPAGGRLEANYRDTAFSYQNLIPNPSLEQGLWQKTVGDCNNYDDSPQVSMDLVRQASEGQKSMRLTASKHIACSGPGEIPVKQGAHYLLSFDYKTGDGRPAGYFLGFNNFEETSVGARLDDTKGEWQQFNTIVTAPEGATKAQLLAYAYPDNPTGRLGTAYYDNFKFIEVPDITGRFLLAGRPQSPGLAPKASFTRADPTKTLITVDDVRKPFFLTTKESYHDLWQLRTADGQYAAFDHLRLNDTMNGWYIEPQALCQQTANSCLRQPDGSYSLKLAMTFAPQRWFYIGSFITLVTAGVVLIFVAFDIRKAIKQRKEHRR